MAGQKTIQIVGGGLAGLTLGIGLRQRSVPVTVWEAGHYPRHRVCGEFISGRGRLSLERLGLLDALNAAGALPARTVAFFSPRQSSPLRELSEPAISISRFTLDALLAEQFCLLGGEILDDERRRDENFGEGVVRATGRRLQPVAGKWRWFGLKVHARNVPLQADLEMHLSKDGYVGMSRLPGGEVNICGLFRRPAAAVPSDARPPWQEMLRGAPGALRHERLAQAAFDQDSFCSIAGLSLQPRRAEVSGECCLGDAITMIPPVTGNGMSMAFESAELAVDPLTDYSAGRLDWTAARKLVARRCDERFARRLAWSRLLHRLMFQPELQGVLIRSVPRFQWLWSLLLDRTR